jgi:hypothetical protein
MMLDSLILVLSVTALLQFFVWYCHSIVVASRTHELSEPARDVTGIAARSVSGGEFGRMLQLMRVCAEPGNDGPAMASVRFYYSLLGGMRALLGRSSNGLANWLEGERGRCAYFAAVALDRRILQNRALMSQHISNT